MKRVLFLSCIFLLLFGSFAKAATINISTGLDSFNNLITTNGQADAHWTINNSGAPVITPGGADWWSGSPPYIANGPNSNWISNNAGSSYNGPAPYSFVRTFDLGSANLSAVSITGFWSIADGGTLSLNGNVIASLDVSVSPWMNLYSFSITGPSYFQSGLNTLTMTVTQSDQYYEGARLEGTLTGSPVPLPGALLLFGPGLVGLAAIRIRFKK